MWEIISRTAFKKKKISLLSTNFISHYLGIALKCSQGVTMTLLLDIPKGEIQQPQPPAGSQTTSQPILWL
jgi:hypothetical protein